MKRRIFLQFTSLLLAAGKLPLSRASAADAEANSGKELSWQREFANPPAAAYPWVYGFWIGGNISKEGITADLEAMRDAGIAGMTFMDGGVGEPLGPHRFMSESWLEMFRHLLVEAQRCGVQINLHNAPGDSGSGGPWITPELASQKVIASELFLQGPMHVDQVLPKPSAIKHEYYEDIALLAYPVTQAADALAIRIADFDAKSFGGGRDFAGVVPWPRVIPTQVHLADVSADQRVRSSEMLDLRAHLDQDGGFQWDVPPGRWIVLRVGHTVANGTTRTTQEEASGLECDKLSRAAVEKHFTVMVGKLAAQAKDLGSRALVSTHIDSWEAGSGNWTRDFRAEFQRRRGYDVLPYLPTLRGIIVDSPEISERFLWDYRETVCELLLENYADHMRELAKAQGLRLSIEAYDGTCDDLRYAGRADEPMSEFWQSSYSGLPMADLTESMASAAHVYGKPIVAAEAFTSYRGDFLDHPATLKPLADWAFCSGVNRLCLHNWVMQPWPHIVPGLSFVFVGTIFQRSLTWWKQSRPWHEYLARCQHVLRQGQFVADICFLGQEGAPYRFTPPIAASKRGITPTRLGFSYDGCPAEVLLSATVKDGHLALPSGMTYALLVLPTYDADGQRVMRLVEGDDYVYQPAPILKTETMTPALLRKIKDLVEAGLTVLGSRPLKSPSLAGFPQCDLEVEQLADALWGERQGRSGSGEHRVGKGLVFWGYEPQQVLKRMGIAADFSRDDNLQGKLNYIHRRTDSTDHYFVVNQEDSWVQGTVTFRITGREATLYWPQTGRSEPVLAPKEERGVTAVPLCLHANESVFVVFHKKKSPSAPIEAITRHGEPLWPTPARTDKPKKSDDSFVMAAWVTPFGDIGLPIRVASGWSYESPRAIAAPGIQTYTSPGQGRAGFALGSNGIVVFCYKQSGAIKPLLVFPSNLAPVSTHIGVVYRGGIAKLFLNGKLAQTGPKNPLALYGTSTWADHRSFAERVAAFRQFDDLLRDAGNQSEAFTLPPRDAPVFDFSRGEIGTSGTYNIRHTDGTQRNWRIRLPPPQEIRGPWEIHFDPRWGGPGTVQFEALDDWSKRPESGIRYYSGSAIYRKRFDFGKRNNADPSSIVYLDLGQVAVIADVTLNGRNLGILWNSPFQIEVTDVLQDKDNELEIKLVNVWVNRLIGDEQLAEDSERNPYSGLNSWPKWLLDGKASPTGRYTLTSFRHWNKASPLVKSGLLGPVHLRTVAKIG